MVLEFKKNKMVDGYPKVYAIGRFEYQLVEVGVALNEIEPSACSLKVGVPSVIIPGGVGGEWQTDVSCFA